MSKVSSTANQGADFDKLTKIISEITFTPASEIRLDSDLFDDLGMDSIGTVEAFVAIEEQFGVKVKYATLQRADFDTPAKLLALVHGNQSNP
jgi:acyl carrier protein